MTLPEPAIPEPWTDWLVCDPVRDALSALDPLLARAAARDAPAAIRRRPSAVVGGGKRLRAAMVLLAGTFGDRREQLLEAALIPEMLHAGSLIQDDIMDGADRRRGAPAVYRVVGAGTASLFATHLYCDAFAIVSRLSIDARARAVRAARGLCRGQALELRGTGGGPPSVAQYRRVVAGKTASLFSVAAWLGGSVAGARPSQIHALEGFAHRFGMLYQIVDDLVDVFGDPRAVGKPTGADVARGLLTLPWIYWLAERPERAVAARLARGEELSPRESAAAMRDLRRSPAVERTLADAEAWTRGAARRLEALPDGAARESLRRLLTSVADQPRRMLATPSGRERRPRPTPVATVPATPSDPLPVRSGADWTTFRDVLSRRLPWFAERDDAVRRCVGRRLASYDRPLMDRFLRHRGRTTLVEGLAAATPIVFGTGSRQEVGVAAALQLLLAAEHCQRGLERDPQPHRILAADFLLCEFMGLLAEQPRGGGERLADAAARYTAVIGAGLPAADPRRSTARLRLALTAWDVAVAPAGAAEFGAFGRDKIGRLLEAAERLEHPGVLGEPSTLRAWTAALCEDTCHLAGWLHGFRHAEGN